MSRESSSLVFQPAYGRSPSSPSVSAWRSPVALPQTILDAQIVQNAGSVAVPQTIELPQTIAEPSVESRIPGPQTIDWPQTTEFPQIVVASCTNLTNWVNWSNVTCGDLADPKVAGAKSVLESA